MDEFGTESGYAILDAITASIVVLDSHGTILTCNSAWMDFARDNGLRDLTSVSVGANYLTACRVSDGPDADIAGSAELGIRDVLSGSRPSFALEYPCPSEAHQRWFLMNAAPLIHDGEISGAVIVHTDITSRVLAEEAVRQNQRAIRRERDFSDAVLDTAGALVVVLDQDGRIVRMNRTCEELTGYGIQEVKGQRLRNLFRPPEAAEPERPAEAEAKPQETPGRSETYWLTKQGGLIKVAWSTTHLPGDNGGPSYTVSVGIDITEQDSLERARKREFESLHAYSRYREPAQDRSVVEPTEVDRSPRSFGQIGLAFEDLLDQALERTVFREDGGISETLKGLAAELAAQGAGPRDVVTIYVNALKQKNQHAPPEKVQAYTDEGRLLLIELMGHLASYYRDRCESDD
jgi:PAS domain S-box-containing protein